MSETLNLNHLRRRLAEAQGLLHQMPLDLTWEAKAPDGSLHYGLTPESAMYIAENDASFPNWPDNLDDALALCLEIGAVVIGVEEGDLQVGATPGYYASFHFKSDIPFAFGPTEAEALAHLAWAYFEARK